MMMRAADGRAPGSPSWNWNGLNTVLYRYCLVVTGTKEDAEDLAQNTWIKAIPVLLDQGHANPEAFLLRVAKNSWIDECRRKAAFMKRLAGLRLEKHVTDERRFEIEHIFQALRSGLSPLQRTVFLLREALGYSIAETAKLLDTTEGAVKAAHRRARLAMESVRERLKREANGTALPELEEDERHLLARLADAYMSGDADALVGLMIEEERMHAAVHAAGMAGGMPVAQAAAAPSPQRSGITMWMAA